jgi:hypothetical protein
MMRSTTLGSVRTAMIFISKPHWAYRRGSTSKIFLIRSAQVARLEVDVVERLSVSVEERRLGVRAFCDEIFRFRLA